MINKERLENLVEEFFTKNNDFFTLQDVEALERPSAFRVELLGQNESEVFAFSFGVILKNEKDSNEDEILNSLRNLQKGFNKLIAKFKMNLDYEKELIDSGDLERWVKQDGFTLENLLECKKDYMHNLDSAVNIINEAINEHNKIWNNILKGEER